MLSVKQEIAPDGGRLVVELRNDDGCYASPGMGDLSVIDVGSQLEFSPGYFTSRVSEALRPAAAGDEENIHSATSVAGNHWQDVDDVTSEDDNSTVWESIIDSNYYLDLYAVVSPVMSGVIRGVTVCARCRAHLFQPTRPGLKIDLKTHGTVYEGAEETLIPLTPTIRLNWLLTPIPVSHGPWEKLLICRLA